jgi:hypothetical protein
MANEDELLNDLIAQISSGKSLPISIEKDDELPERVDKDIKRAKNKKVSTDKRKRFSLDETFLDIIKLQVKTLAAIEYGDDLRYKELSSSNLIKFSVLQALSQDELNTWYKNAEKISKTEDFLYNLLTSRNTKNKSKEKYEEFGAIVREQNRILRDMRTYQHTQDAMLAVLIADRANLISPPATTDEFGKLLSGKTVAQILEKGLEYGTAVVHADELKDVRNMRKKL